MMISFAVSMPSSAAPVALVVLAVTIAVLVNEVRRLRTEIKELNELLGFAAWKMKMGNESPNRSASAEGKSPPSS